MSYQPLVDAWHDSREDRTPLRPSPRRRGRWASLEHAVAGGTRRGDRAGIADTTPGRARGPIQTEGPGIDDTDTHDDMHSFDLDEFCLDDTEVDYGHQPEPEDDPELGDDEAGDDDEEPAA